MSTEAQLKALSNSELASGTQIPALKHRTVNNAIIEEMYDSQSRGDVLSGVQSALSLASGDQVLVIRSGAAFLLDATEFGFVDTLADLTDVSIPSPSNDQILAYNSGTSKWVAKDVNDLTSVVSITGAATTNQMVKFTGANSIGDSIVSDDGTTVNVGGNLSVDNNLTVGTINSGTSSDFVKGDGSLDSTDYQGQITTNASNISTNTSDISTNTSNISTNTSDIATNTSNIATNTSDIADLQNDKQDISEKNQANGYAPLDSGAKIPIANLPDSVVGQVEYQGTWNASTDTPTLPAASGVKGHYYVVSVGGTYETIVYAVGDWIISNGTAWEKVDNTDAVTTVFGRLGAIIANESDYSSFYPLISDLNTTNSNVSALDTRLTTAEGDIVAIETKTDNITVTQPVNLDTMESDIATNASNISSNDTDIANLQSDKYDKTGGTISGSVTVTGDLSATNLTGTVSATSVLANGVTATTQTLGDNSTKVATTAYVDAQVTASDLDFAGDTGTGAVDLDSQTFTIAGTANEIETSASGQTVTIGLPSSVTVGTLSATTLAGTLNTAAQPNITSVGTLSSLAVSGNVGIGTSSPVSKTTILSTDAPTLDNDTHAGEALFLRSGGSAGQNNVQAVLAFGKADGANVRTGSAIGSIQTDTDADKIGLAFYTSPSSASAQTLSEKMRIDSSGNVGIGTDVPGAQLELARNAEAGSGSDLALYNNSFTLGGFVRIRMGRAFNRQASIKAISTTSGGRNTDIVFESKRGDGGDDTTFSENMRITSSGNVGIGISNPDSYDANADNLVIGSTGANDKNGITIVGGDTDGRGAVYFADTTQNSAGFITYLHSNNSMLFGTSDTERMRIDSSGDVGIGTANPSTKLDVNGSFSVETDTIYAASGNVGIGVVPTARLDVNGTSRFRNNVGINQSPGIDALGVGGNVVISGSLSKGSGSFKIDHPLPEKKDTHHLVHSFVEAPQADNIYRGKIDLADGKATVNLDEAGRMTEGTFVLLNGNIQCFTSNESGWTAIRGMVEGNTLTIEAQDAECTDTISWLVIGERIDQHMIDTEWTDENGRVITEPLKKVEPTPSEEITE